MLNDLHHSLVAELPEHREAIHRLKVENHHFRHLFDTYHEVDKEIVRIEGEIEPASDQRTVELKRRRLQLKDDLLAIIIHVA